MSPLVKSSSRDEIFSEILLRECDSRVFTFGGVTGGGDLTREPPAADARHHTARFGRREEEGLLATPSTGFRASKGRWLGNFRGYIFGSSMGIRQKQSLYHAPNANRSKQSKIEINCLEFLEKGRGI